MVIYNQNNFNGIKTKRLGDLTLEKLDARIEKLEKRMDAIDLDLKQLIKNWTTNNNNKESD